MTTRRVSPAAYTVSVVGRDDTAFPRALLQRLGAEAPTQLTLLGNARLLGLPKTALFCSVRCPGEVILAALDQATRWRGAGRCVIGGFQAPLEKECLRVLLRGQQPVVVCVARGLSTTSRVAPDWQQALAEGRLLLVSGSSATERRVTARLAWRRNLLAAALADEVHIAHATPGGALEALGQRLRHWPGFGYTGACQRSSVSHETCLTEDRQQGFDNSGAIEQGEASPSIFPARGKGCLAVRG